MTGEMVTVPREDLERMAADLADLKEAAGDRWSRQWTAYRERVRTREREGGEK
jgi:hypothetical protein